MKKSAPIELMASYWLFFTPVVGLCITWLWWSNARNLAMRPLLGVGATWVAFSLALQNSLQYVVIHIPSSADFQIRWMTLASGQYVGLDWSWHLAFWGGSPFSHGATSYILCFILLSVLVRAVSGSTRPPFSGIQAVSSR